MPKKQEKLALKEQNLQDPADINPDVLKVLFKFGKRNKCPRIGKQLTTRNTE